MESNEKALATTNSTTMLQEMGNELGSIACTMNIDADADKRDALFNALSAESTKLSSMINKTISIVDVYAEVVESTDEETGEVGKFTMLLLFDKDGTVYRCGSTGVLTSLRRAFLLYGPPTWKDGLKFEVIQNETKNGRVFGLKRVK